MNGLLLDCVVAGSVGMTYQINGVWPLNSSSSDDLEAADRQWQWNVSSLTLPLNGGISYDEIFKFF